MHDTKTNTNNNLHLQTVSSKRAALARKALVWSNSSVKLQFALYMSRRFFDCQVISLQKIQNL